MKIETERLDLGAPIRARRQGFAAHEVLSDRAHRVAKAAEPAADAGFAAGDLPGAARAGVAARLGCAAVGSIGRPAIAATPAAVAPRAGAAAAARSLLALLRAVIALAGAAIGIEVAAHLLA